MVEFLELSLALDKGLEGPGEIRSLLLPNSLVSLVGVPVVVLSGIGRRLEVEALGSSPSFSALTIEGRDSSSSFRGTIRLVEDDVMKAVEELAGFVPS